MCVFLLFRCFTKIIYSVWHQLRITTKQSNTQHQKIIFSSSAQLPRNTYCSYIEVSSFFRGRLFKAIYNILAIAKREDDSLLISTVFWFWWFFSDFSQSSLIVLYWCETVWLIYMNFAWKMSLNNRIACAGLLSAYYTMLQIPETIHYST